MRTRSALCRREGIATNFYTWSEEFLDAGKKRLVGDTERQADSRDVPELWNEVSQLKQQVAELSLKNRVLEKNVLGREKPWSASSVGDRRRKRKSCEWWSIRHCPSAAF